ncbi:hypothetical protein [Olsenella urininfantis]|uniref:hypothetical protein n=1 Tax=Olsenella urininfantis TaxID=1871033 RepID=UPI000985FF1F|nr:hypothetical protein [Olsenella urininfantis]
MVVEFAVMVPVAIAVGLVAFNLARFTWLCAAFDRASLDIVVAHGVSPEGEQRLGVATQQVKSALEEAMPGSGVEVGVEAEDLSQAAAGGQSSASTLSFPISPLLTRFRCTLRYQPWPAIDGFAGVRIGTPLALEHQRSIVVDRFRPGVVV